MHSSYSNIMTSKNGEKQGRMKKEKGRPPGSDIGGEAGRKGREESANLAVSHIKGE